MLASSILSIPLIVQLVYAQITPTTPGPNETYTAGSPCRIAWSTDTSRKWLNVTIDLMSGSNLNMSLVANVASGLDGTDSSVSPFSWTCPEVSPYSAIYFYQFTTGNATANATWTTRFTIASPAGESVPPNATAQPNGDRIPWGTGHLATKTNPSTTPKGDNRTSKHEFDSLGLSSLSMSAIPISESHRDRGSKHSNTILDSASLPTTDPAHDDTESRSTHHSTHHRNTRVHESKTADDDHDELSTQERKHSRTLSEAEASKTPSHQPSGARKDSPFASAETSSARDCYQCYSVKSNSRSRDTKDRYYLASYFIALFSYLMTAL